MADNINLSGASITFTAIDETETAIGDSPPIRYEDLIKMQRAMVIQHPTFRPDYVVNQIGDRIVCGDRSVLHTSSTPSGGEGAFERLYQRSVERLHTDWADAVTYGAISPTVGQDTLTEYDRYVVNNERKKNENS